MSFMIWTASVCNVTSFFYRIIIQVVYCNLVNFRVHSLLFSCDYNIKKKKTNKKNVFLSQIVKKKQRKKFQIWVDSVALKFVYLNLYILLLSKCTHFLVENYVIDYEATITIIITLKCFACESYRCPLGKYNSRLTSWHPVLTV